MNTLFMAVVFAIALAVGLAFGLGGRDTAARVWQRWYAQGQEMAPRLEAAAEPAGETVENRVERRSPAPSMAHEVERRRGEATGRYRPTTE